MEISLLEGFKLIFQPNLMFYLIAGTIAGIIVGAIPGLSASTGIILFLPIAYKMPAAEAFIVMLGIYGGSMFGGSIPAILIRTPGTPSAGATVLDGYPLAQKGKAGLALGTSAISSSIGSLLSTIALVIIAPQLAKMALKFGPPEFFALVVFGLTAIATVTGEDILKGFISAFIGLFLATIGLDPIMGYTRFSFGSLYLESGIPLLPVMIGVFAIAQVFRDLLREEKGQIIEQNVKRVIPPKEEMKGIILAALFGSLVGIVIGIIPGIGGSVATYVAYGQYKRISKKGKHFGEGVLEGVAVSESSNNATTGGALIPLLTLGVPGDIVTAVLLGILVLFGLRPGPLLFREQPEFVNEIFASMFVIAFLIIIFGLISAKYSPKLLTIPKKYLTPIVLIFCIIGAYSLNSSLYDVEIAILFGVLGYFMEKFGFSVTPLLISMILCPIAEGELGRTLLISRGDWSVLFTRPISLIFLVLSVVFVCYAFKGRKEQK